MRETDAPHATLCCPWPALAELSAEELRLLDRFCRRAMADENAEPRGEEIAAVEVYHAALKGLGATVRYEPRERRKVSS